MFLFGFVRFLFNFVRLLLSCALVRNFHPLEHSYDASQYRLMVLFKQLILFKKVRIKSVYVFPTTGTKKFLLTKSVV